MHQHNNTPIPDLISEVWTQAERAAAAAEDITACAVALRLAELGVDCHPVFATYSTTDNNKTWRGRAMAMLVDGNVIVGPTGEMSWPDVCQAHHIKSSVVSTVKIVGVAIGNMMTRLTDDSRIQAEAICSVLRSAHEAEDLHKASPHANSRRAVRL